MSSRKRIANFLGILASNADFLFGSSCYFRSRTLKKIKSHWQNPEIKRSAFKNSTRTLFDLLRKEKDSTRTVDDRTWTDLDFDELFQEADITWTNIGRQSLYCRFRFLRSTEELSENNVIINQVFTDPSVRESISYHLHNFGSSSVNDATNLLFNKFEYVDISKKLPLIWFLICIFSLHFSLVYGGFFWLLFVCIVAVNFVLSQRFERQLNNLSHGYYELHKITSTAFNILNDKSLSDVELVRKSSDFKGRLRKIKWISWLTGFSQSSENLILGNAMYLINLASSLEYVLHPFLSASLAKRIDLLRDCYNLIGALDSAISIAKYRSQFSITSIPQFSLKNGIVLSDLYHPLLNDSVPNSVSLVNLSLLVTGSNMAGKTTLIKAVGVNCILAQTLYFCCASCCRLSPLNVYSSIKTNDSISKGKSYYFSEIERILYFLSNDMSFPSLMLIDEIFRGTNTLERIAGAAAVLQELSLSHNLLVTSHDIELEDFLTERFEFFHFSETGSIENPFDYILRQGVCNTRNALKLMERIGFPSNVVNKSIDYSNFLRRNNATSKVN